MLISWQACCRSWNQSKEEARVDMRLGNNSNWNCSSMTRPQLNSTIRLPNPWSGTGLPKYLRKVFRFIQLDKYTEVEKIRYFALRPHRFNFHFVLTPFVYSFQILKFESWLWDARAVENTRLPKSFKRLSPLIPVVIESYVTPLIWWSSTAGWVHVNHSVSMS